MLYNPFTLKYLLYKKEHNIIRLNYYKSNPDLFIEDYSTIRNIQFELSSRCNLKCSFCSQQFKTDKGIDMPFEKAIEYLDKLPDTVDFMHLHFSGESFLNKDISKIIKVISERGIYTSVSTNGTISPDRYISALEAGLNRLIFAIDGAKSETHERHRIGSNLNKIKKALEIVAKRKMKNSSIGVQYLVTRYSENEIELMRYYLKNIGVDFFNLKSISLDIASNERLEKNMLESAWRILPKRNKYSRYAIKKNKIHLKYPVFVCRQVSQPVINATGDVSLCCIDLDNKIKIGNINNYSSFNDLWKSNHYKQIRKSVLKKNNAVCRICNYSQIGLEPVKL